MEINKEKLTEQNAEEEKKKKKHRTIAYVLVVRCYFVRIYTKGGLIDTVARHIGSVSFACMSWHLRHASAASTKPHFPIEHFSDDIEPTPHHTRPMSFVGIVNGIERNDMQRRRYRTMCRNITTLRMGKKETRAVNENCGCALTRGGLLPKIGFFGDFEYNG